MLSVIVPVYNAEAFLVRCLDSLLNQDVEDYEIVCVNDGSTDKSGSILKEYKNAYPQVLTLVEQENQGLPAARNAGMAVAKGDQIAFCDSDDYVIPGAYGYILKTFWKEDIDVLKFNSITVDRYVQKEWKETNDVRGKVLFEGRGTRYVVERAPNFSFVWSYIYNNAFLSRNKITFRPIRQCEDVAFNLDVYMCDPYVMQVSSNIYRYTVSEGQITRVREPHHMRSVVESYMCLFDNMNAYMQQKPEIKEALQTYKQRETIPCMSRVLSADYTRKEFLSVKNSFLQLEVLPMRLQGKATKVINAVMTNYFMYWMAGFLYRRLFVPYVLPRLRRN